jgi:hypothetical protein
VAIVLLLGSLIIAESRDRSEKRELDFAGVFLSAFGLLAFVYGVIESATYGWWHAKQAFSFFGHTLPFGLSPTPYGLLVGVLLLAAFCWWQINAENHGHTPLVSMHLFRNTQFTSGVTVITFLSLGMVGLIFAIPVFLQSVRNLDALHTGLALAPMSLTMLIVAPGSAFLSKHITPKRLIQFGLFTASLAGLVMYSAITPDATPANFVPGMILFGMGMGLVMAQASNLTLSAVSVEQAGEASGVNNTLRQVGSSFGSAIIGAVLLATMASSLATGIDNSQVIPAAVKPQIAQAVAAQSANVELGGVSSESQSALSPEIQGELKTIVNQASSDGSRKAILFTSFFVGLGFLASFLLPNVKDLDRTARAASAH